MSNYSNVMMVSIDVSKYEGRKADKNAARKLDNEANIVGKGYSASKMACDAEEMSGYLQPYNKMMTWFGNIKNSLPAGNGQFIIRVEKYQEAVNVVDEFKTAFWRGVETFVNNWEEIKEKQKLRLNDAWRESDYPTNIRVKFGCQILFQPMPDASALRNYTGIPADDVDRLIEENENALHGKYKNGIKAVYEKAHELASKYAEKLADEGARFKDSLVNNIQELIDLLPSLNITNDPDLVELGNKLTDLIEVPTILRYDLNKRKEAAEKAERVMKDLEGYF